MIQPYHLIVLFCCAVIGLVEGICYLVYGSAPNSRFYRFDRYVVHLLGVGLIVFSALLLFRQFWAIDGLILFVALSIIECLLTFRPEAQASAKRIGAFRVMMFWIASIAIFYGTQITLLIWLRPAFTH